MNQYVKDRQNIAAPGMINPLPQSSLTQEALVEEAPPEDWERRVIELYDAYRKDLFEFAMDLVHDENLARQAVHEVLLRYGLLLKGGRLMPAPRAWLFRVLRNYLRDRRPQSPPE